MTARDALHLIVGATVATCWACWRLHGMVEAERAACPFPHPAPTTEERTPAMWLFCKSGFFSAVAHLDKPGTILLRARFRGDLERLCAAHDLDTATIAETPEADYRFRMELPKADWARVAAEEAAAIDYPNFTAATHDGTARDAAYLGAWCALRAGQGRAR